jgi:hypothetical protein
LAAGSQNVQYKLQTLASNLSTSTTSGSYVVDANIGPNGDYYFIRMEGNTLNKTTGYPAETFSARFTLSSMTGTFNSTVLAAAQGAEGSASSTAASSSKSTATSSSLSKTASSSSTSSSVAASSTAKTSSQASTSSAGKTQQGLFIVASTAAAALAFMVLI